MEGDSEGESTPGRQTGGTSVSSQPKLHQHILFVDDQNLNRMLGARLLMSAGHTVETAVDGVEALEKLESLQFSVCFIDMHMPRMAGDECVRKFRQFERQHGRPPMPIFMLTGNATATDLENAKAAGCTRVLSKPATLEQMLAALSGYTSIPLPKSPIRPMDATHFPMPKDQPCRGNGVGRTRDAAAIAALPAPPDISLLHLHIDNGLSSHSGPAAGLPGALTVAIPEPPITVSTPWLTLDTLGEATASSHDFPDFELSVDG